MACRSLAPPFALTTTPGAREVSCSMFRPFSGNSRDLLLIDHLREAGSATLKERRRRLYRHRFSLGASMQSDVDTLRRDLAMQRR